MGHLADHRMEAQKNLPRLTRWEESNPKKDKLMKIAIVGLGYVGLPLALRFSEKGAHVLGIDVDDSKTAALNSGKSYIKYIGSNRIRKAVADGGFKAVCDFSAVGEVDGVIVCVPTPLSAHREPDLSYVLGTAAAIAPHLTKGMVIVLESTTYPGTTEGPFRAALEKGSGLVAGKDFHLAFSPEREDPGNDQSLLDRVPKLIGGFTPDCLRKSSQLYAVAVPNLVPVSSCGVAEAAKLLENIFRGVNIALVNELKVVYAAMGIDIWEVIEAAKTKPFGFMPFYPGPGLGGHCIPIDPFYLTWKAREFGINTRFIELAGEINTSMTGYVVGRVIEALNDSEKSVKGSKILLLGLAYKADIDDDRESPSYTLMQMLEKMGARVDYHDPFIPEIRMTRQHSKLLGRKSVAVSANYDVIVLATAHSAFKNIDFTGLGVPVVDTRNCVAKKPARYYKA